MKLTSTQMVPLLISLSLVPVHHVFSQDTSPTKKVVWSDEFNGSKLNRDVWVHDTGGKGWGNGQLEFNTDRPENSYVKDGNLVIEAKREKFKDNQFTSARIHTRGRFAFQYGILEAKIKAPDTANGIWPAFWMLGHRFPKVRWPNCGEIDILEIGSKKGFAEGKAHRRINAALHFAGKDEKKTSLVEWHDATVDLHRDYHRYRIEWTPKFISVALDQKEFARFDITAPEMAEYHQPFYPLINVAVGSRADSYTSAATPKQVTAKLPSRMFVDWIRLYGNEHTKVLVTPPKNASSSENGKK